MKKYILSLIFLSAIGFCDAQNHRFYVRAIAHNFTPTFTMVNGVLDYTGSDVKLNQLFDKYDIYKFEKAFTHSRRSPLQRVWYMEADSQTVLNVILQLSHVFEFGEYIGVTIPHEDVLLGDCGCDKENQKTVLSSFLDKASFDLRKKESIFSNYFISNPFYPDDYGQTGGANLGLNVDYSNYDFIDASIAWGITTGDPNLKIGISDGAVNPNDQDLDKIEEIGNPCPNSFCLNHGTNVAAGAAGQGNNTHGVTGVCYDCDLISGPHNDYDELLALSFAGAKVINCSWALTGYCQTQQDAIDEIYDNGSIIVAGAGNTDWQQAPGGILEYPAAYNHVISVSSEGQKYNTVMDSVFKTYSNGNHFDWRAHNVKDHVSWKLSFIGDPNTDPNTPYFSRPEGTNTLNSEVDILAPGSRIFRYGDYINDGDWEYNNSATSPAAPHVTGTIGLMLSVNSCLSFEEVESILKISSTHIGNIQANQVFEGNYGSGSLNAGRAVTLTDALLDPTKIAFLENQRFSRWNFTFKGVSNRIVMRNQEFTDAATVDVLAKKRIVIVNSLIEPDSNGAALFDIDPNLTITNNCVFNPPPPPNPIQEEEIDKTRFKVYPTRVETILNVTPKDEEVISQISRIEVYDLFNRKVFDKEGFTTSDIQLELTGLKAGIYIVKGYTTTGEVVITEKIIKN